MTTEKMENMQKVVERTKMYREALKQGIKFYHEVIFPEISEPVRKFLQEHLLSKLDESFTALCDKIKFTGHKELTPKNASVSFYIAQPRTDNPNKNWVLCTKFKKENCNLNLVQTVCEDIKDARKIQDKDYYDFCEYLNSKGTQYTLELPVLEIVIKDCSQEYGVIVEKSENLLDDYSKDYLYFKYNCYFTI